jgi:hypothetical protein
LLSLNITECSIRLTAWELSGISAQSNAFDISNRTEIILDPKTTRPVDGGYDETFMKATGPGIVFTIKLIDWMAITSFIVNQLKEVRDVITSQVSLDWGSTASPILASSAGDITDWVPRMTQAMTDAVRSGPNKQLAYGNNRESIIYVEVTWPKGRHTSTNPLKPPFPVGG